MMATFNKTDEILKTMEREERLFRFMTATIIATGSLITLGGICQIPRISKMTSIYDLLLDDTTLWY